MSEAGPSDDTIEEAVRLTRLARRAVDEAEAQAYRERRASILDEHGFVARLREDPTDPVLICYPTEWVVDGEVDTERIEDLDRAVERPLAAGRPDEPWDDIEAHNQALVEAVRDEAGDDHAQNVAAFAAFMSNHRARQLETASADDVREFLDDYYLRNAWPTETQRELVRASIRRAFTVAESEVPAPVQTER